MRDEYSEEVGLNFDGPQQHDRSRGGIFKSLPKYFLNLWKKVLQAVGLVGLIDEEIDDYENDDEYEYEEEEYEETDAEKYKKVEAQLKEVQAQFRRELRTNASAEEVENLTKELSRLNRLAGELEQRLRETGEFFVDSEDEPEEEDLFDYFGRLARKTKNSKAYQELVDMPVVDLDDKEEEERFVRMVEEEKRAAQKTPQEELIDSINAINSQFADDEPETLEEESFQNDLMTIAKTHNLEIMSTPQGMLNFDFDSIVSILTNVVPKSIDGICCPIDKKTGKMIADEEVQIQIIVGLMWYKVNSLFNRKGLDTNCASLFNDLIQSIVQNYYLFNLVDIDLNMIKNQLEPKNYQGTDIKVIETLLSNEEAQNMLKQYVINLIVRKQLGAYEQFDKGTDLSGVSFH